MSDIEVVGYALIALPFVAAFALVWVIAGWKSVVILACITVLTSTPIIIGARMAGLE